MIQNSFTFREAWLHAGIDAMRGKIESAGYTLPEKLKITCGWPVGARGGKKIIGGQCIRPECSAGAVTELCVSPMLSDPVIVLGIVLHELGHAAVGVEAGHGKPFKAFCDALGLTGKATEAMPGESCRKWLVDYVLPALGPYPHDAIDLSTRKKQTTRMIKLVCPETGYTVRTTQKWLDVGVPVSPAGYEMMQEGEGEEE